MIIVDVFGVEFSETERLEYESRVREAMKAKYGPTIKVFFRYN